jgi:colanic acid/amylovoran biosynthesis glycosyltransferase
VGEIRVLHSVLRYLNLTENWVEPQVFRVPGSAGRILCESRVNEAAFPLQPSAAILDPPARTWHWRQRDWARRRADRLGCNRWISEMRVRAWRPHLVHAHFGPRGWATRNLARRMGTPLITSFYGYDAWMAPRLEPEWHERYADLFAQGAVFLVEGPAMRDRLVALGCPHDKVVVHRIGVDTAGLVFQDRAFESPVSIAMIGRFVEKKGMADGLRACALASRGGIDLRVTIVGDASPGDAGGQRIATELRSLADSPDLKGRVRFTGFLSADETREVVATHDVFLCPSRHAANGDAEGGSPVVLTEAMAMGAYCIASRHCDIPEVVIDGRTGALCAEGDVDGFAAAIGAIRGAETRIREMSRAGRQHVDEAFCLHTQLAGLGRIYERLAGGAAQQAG